MALDCLLTSISGIQRADWVRGGWEERWIVWTFIPLTATEAFNDNSTITE